MTDHPLIPQEIRAYMEQHQLELNLNKALNKVLSTLPQDPFSTMAVSLIDANEVNPNLAKLVAKETYLCDLQQQSICIDVYLSF